MYKEYNMNQIILPLDLNVKLQENDIGFLHSSFSGKYS